MKALKILSLMKMLKLKILPCNFFKLTSQISVILMSCFTIYIATYGDPDFTIAKSTYAIGETVYAKAGDLDTSKYYKIRL